MDNRKVGELIYHLRKEKAANTETISGSNEHF